MGRRLIQSVDRQQAHYVDQPRIIPAAPVGIVLRPDVAESHGATDGLDRGRMCIDQGLEQGAEALEVEVEASVQGADLEPHQEGKDEEIVLHLDRGVEGDAATATVPTAAIAEAGVGALDDMQGDKLFLPWIYLCGGLVESCQRDILEELKLNRGLG